MCKQRWRWPQSELADTPQNIAIIAFLLGGLCSLGCVVAYTAASSVQDQSWLSILRSRALGLYAAAWSLFHMLEYIVTASCSPTSASVHSFLLNNGMQYHLAHAFAIAEYFATCRLYSSHSAHEKAILTPVGVCMVIAAQWLRSQAMITAATNFTHKIATKKRDGHVLVTRGVYAWTRHPSYVAFMYWALGTQLILGNVISFIAFAAILWYYFSHRIKVEERHLEVFFGDEYETYRRRVPTRLPFIQ